MHDKFLQDFCSSPDNYKLIIRFIKKKLPGKGRKRKLTVARFRVNEAIRRAIFDEAYATKKKIVVPFSVGECVATRVGEEKVSLSVNLK